MIKRLIDEWRARRFVTERERLLQSDNPVLAFAGDPAGGRQILRPGETNEAAFALLKNGDVPLIRIHDGVDAPAKQFDRLIFGVPWDALTATVIGSHRKPFDAGRLGSFAVVFVESSREELAARTADKWYRPSAFVLPDGHPLSGIIAAIPFTAVKRDDGSFEFAEGLEKSSFRDGRQSG